MKKGILLETANGNIILEISSWIAKLRLEIGLQSQIPLGKE